MNPEPRPHADIRASDECSKARAVSAFGYRIHGDQMAFQDCVYTRGRDDTWVQICIVPASQGPDP